MRRYHDNSLLYIHAYTVLKKQIQSGELIAGTKLLSKRLMAEASGTSINTVDSAYQQLVSEGYLEARQEAAISSPILGRWRNCPKTCLIQLNRPLVAI